MGGNVPDLGRPAAQRQQDGVEQEGYDQSEGQSLPQRHERACRCEQAIEQAEDDREALVHQATP